MKIHIQAWVQKTGNDAIDEYKISIFVEYPNAKEALNQIETDKDGWDKI